MITTYVVVYNPKSAVPGRFYMNTIRLSDYKLWNRNRKDDAVLYQSPFRSFCEEFMKFCVGTANNPTHEEFVNPPDVVLQKIQAVFALDLFGAFLGNLFGLLDDEDLNQIKEWYIIEED
jgi:hypothetical protein